MDQSQRAKAVDEERRRRLEDEVLGLEPRDVALAVLALDAAKAHEGMHLVEIAPHRARQQREPVHQRIARDLQQRPLAMRARARAAGRASA